METIGEVCNNFCSGDSGGRSIRGEVIVMKKNVLDLYDAGAGLLDVISEIFGKHVCIQLVSSSQVEQGLGRGRLSKPGRLKNWLFAKQALAAGETRLKVELEWDSSLELPGAVIITNNHHTEFFLRSLTLYLPEHGNIHFDCHSWVYPQSKYGKPRIFFSNKSYLPAETPAALVALRNAELAELRGDGTGKREKWDRIYDYDYYNDLGNPDKSEDLRRPVLGGSADYPYPRRCRTGRARAKSDPASESRLFSLDLDIYVPRDERFGHLKLSDFLAYALKSLFQFLMPLLESTFDSTPNEFDSMQDVMDLYFKGITLPSSLETISRKIPLEFIRELLQTDDARLLKYPVPQVIQHDRNAWRTDEEFARETLAGVNPVVIQRLTGFPPESRLDPETYGPRRSSITESHIEPFLGGLTVRQAIAVKRLFILDHHDSLLPYVNQINSLEGIKIYASRTILFLRNDGTLKPVAIELSLPRKESKQAESTVFTPPDAPDDLGVKSLLWLLAKAYFAVNDSGQHQLISHWLLTHAAIEPVVIATNRQLSVMHPVHKLLYPHFRDNMNINAFSRLILINAGGILEKTVFPGKYSMEMSSFIYREFWRFDHQALPEDLLQRGMAERDETRANGLKLVLEDYPYAVDGLEVWAAIHSWVKTYVSLYYTDDEAVKSDTEIQSWWTEIREVGHGDKKDADWWYSMDSTANLVKALETIIWVASALHAAINFGQYAYAGFMPNRPTISRKLLPALEQHSAELEEMVRNPDKALLGTISNQFQTTLGIALIEILSRHSSDEVYLGQRDCNFWTDDARAIQAFERFAAELKEIEQRIMRRNADDSLKNRKGPAMLDYTLLYPNTSDVSGVGGITGRGIPNSISI